MCRRERTIRDTFRRKEVRCEEVEGEVKRKGVQMGVLARTGRFNSNEFFSRNEGEVQFQLRNFECVSC